jgi:hypothetical protein
MFCLWGPADCILFSLPMWLRMPARHIVSFGWTGEYVNTYLFLCVNSLFLCPCLLFHLSLSPPPPRPPPPSLSVPPSPDPPRPHLDIQRTCRSCEARRSQPRWRTRRNKLSHFSLFAECRARWAGEEEGKVGRRGGGARCAPPRRWRVCSGGARHIHWQGYRRIWSSECDHMRRRICASYEEDQ